MRHTLEPRLQELRAEQATGQQELAALEQRRLVLTQTLLRISGAIQVLEELLAIPEGTDANTGSPAEVTIPNGAATTNGHREDADA